MEENILGRGEQDGNIWCHRCSNPGPLLLNSRDLHMRTRLLPGLVAAEAKGDLGSVGPWYERESGQCHRWSERGYFKNRQSDVHSTLCIVVCRWIRRHFSVTRFLKTISRLAICSRRSLNRLLRLTTIGRNSSSGLESETETRSESLVVRSSARSSPKTHLEEALEASAVCHPGQDLGRVKDKKAPTTS